ncbi:bifunctional glutamate--cysteine ligase GshA/glutathione synthetase GshB [Clostridium gasigenes]|uniref:bifunctional glutamate--cysteine ligase GshA/glutathione synthetase GshB n=1 Tax=Clostridium gasigenes TaxID=94869 RepID=UPI001C0BFCDA|nr:bifunctional glutamate--cysteine ligase GshA/glutathione synthetase GshB [Clostridium gasigenes]MBU3106274.1 bifunctional glutamate--cysteine ligase GshA/glutathione synthetase GshB [Clostridium gasigenes]
MLHVLKTFRENKEILKGTFGVEREGLRVDLYGNLSETKHPKLFGEKLSNPYITTDFSESQVELITPTFNSLEEVYDFLNSLYNITALELEDEYLWPQSMPCNIPDDENIPIADFSGEKEGQKARDYREKLHKKYGGKKQLISGIHYNFSFNEKIIRHLYDSENTNESYKEFRDNIYLKVVRNYLRYRWFLIYILGGTAVIHESYAKECVKKLQEISTGSFTSEGALSYRNSECGYRNHIDLFPNYSTVNEYVNSIKTFVNDDVIESHKELYSQIRLKARDNNDFLNSLSKDGIDYLEIRSTDINPFDKAGISLEDLKFINIFTIFLLTEEENNYSPWQEEALYNQNIIARFGQQNVMLRNNGDQILKEKWALNILNKIEEINKELNLDHENIIENVKARVLDPRLTYAYRISEMVKENGYINGHLELAKKYKKEAYKDRFKLYGYEDLELSTQILMKEAIKRGIKVELIDRSENFISLRTNNKVEYVKEATKTSKDNYVSVLMMENKVVTKKILKENNINVPRGEEYTSFEEGSRNAREFSGKPVVIKPKSTNFGIGISIFSKGADEEDIIDALKIAFKYDNTVLVEEFIKGKEYRFLVIGDEVVGILHRVPANVLGNGKNTIEELVKIKNQSVLRGKGYKTPLEKIDLDENAKLFLKQKGLKFNYIPKLNEVVYLRENSNISTGGDSIDYTDEIPKRFFDIAIEAAKALKVNICGVDMIIEDYKDENSNYGIIELNFNPAIHIHSYPYKGKERNVAEALLKVLELIK